MSKTEINLTNQVKDDSLTNAKIKTKVITGDRLVDGTIKDLQIGTDAEITVSKLNTGPASVCFDDNGTLKSGVVINANVSGSAAIDYSKLNLQTGAVGHVVNADIAPAAGIQTSKFQALTSDRVVITGSAVGGPMAASSITTTEVGYLSGLSSNAQTQINARVLDTGDSMSGNLSMGNNTVTGLRAPTDNTDAATKQYVDNLVSGLTFRPAAEAFDVVDHSDTAPLTPLKGWHYITITTPKLYYYNGTSWVDSVVPLVAGQYYVISKTPVAGGAFAGQGNKIAKWSGSAWSFETALDGWAIFIHEGYYSNNGFVYENSTDLWNQFSGAGQITDGIGLSKDGNVMNVNLGAGIKESPADEIGIDAHANGGLFLTVDGTNASTATAAQLKVKTDGTMLEVVANNVQIKDNGITASKLNTSILAVNGGIAGAGGTALSVNVDGSSIERPTGTLQVKALGIKETHIDWGTAAGQVSTDDIPEGLNASVDYRKYFTTQRAKDAAGAALLDTNSIDLVYSASQISANVKTNSSLTIDGTGLQIAANGVNATHLSSSVAGNGIGGGGGVALNIAGGAGIVVSADGVAVDVGNAALQIPRFNSATVPQLLVNDGTALLPAVSFVSDPNTGVYSSGADSLALSTNGTQRLNITTSTISATLPIAMGSNGITGVNKIANAYGDQAGPGYAFTGDTGTGMFGVSTGTVAFSTGGSEKMRIGPTGFVGIGKVGTTALDVNGVVTATSFTGIGSALTQVNAETVDTLHAASFVRTDASSAVASPFVLTINTGARLDITTAGNWRIGGTAVNTTAAQLNELGTFVDYEQITVGKNGVNQVFAIAHAPKTGSIRVIKNGAQLLMDATKDFVLSGASELTIFEPPLATDDLWVHYRW